MNDPRIASARGDHSHQFSQYPTEIIRSMLSPVGGWCQSWFLDRGGRWHPEEYGLALASSSSWCSPCGSGLVARRCRGPLAKPCSSATRRWPRVRRV